MGSVTEGGSRGRLVERASHRKRTTLAKDCRSCVPTSQRSQEEAVRGLSVVQKTLFVFVTKTSWHNILRDLMFCFAWHKATMVHEVTTLPMAFSRAPLRDSHDTTLHRINLVSLKLKKFTCYDKNCLMVLPEMARLHMNFHAGAGYSE